MQQFFIYLNFKKMADYSFVCHCACVGSKGREVKISRGYVVTLHLSLLGFCVADFQLPILGFSMGLQIWGLKIYSY